MFLPAFVVWLMAGCTLYMDGDTEQDQTADGDGFTAPKTIEDSITSVTYKFRSGTLMLDSRYRPYITHYHTDSLHDRTEICLRRNIPADLLPKRGSRLSTDLYDIFADGLLHEVDAVMPEDGQIVVKAHRTTVDEVFETLRMSSDFYMVLDTTAAKHDRGGTRAPAQGEYTYRLKPVGKRAADGVRTSSAGDDFETNFLHLEMLHLPNSSYGLTDKLGNLSPKTQKILDNLDNVKNRLDKALVKPFGSFDGGVGATFDMGMKLHFEYDKERKFIDLHGWSYQKTDIGLFVREAKGGVCIPLVGWGQKEVRRSNRSVGSSSTEVDNYLLSLKTRDVPIPAGPVKLAVNVQPNLVLDLFASYRLDDGGDGLRFGKRYESNIVEFGFHSDPVDGSYSYPRKKSSEEEHADGNDDEWNTSFAAGMELHASLDFVVKFYEMLQCRVSPQASITVGYEKDLSDKYRLDDFIMGSGTPHTSSFSGASDLYMQAVVGLSLSGVLEFGPLWTVDLFSMDALSSTMNLKWPLYPDFLTTVQPDEDASTQETSACVAEVKASKNFICSPREQPLLAIYCAPSSNTDGRKTFVKLVRPDGATSAFNPNASYRYRFTVPGRDTRHIYYAVPVFLTGYGITREYLHGTPVPFYSTYGCLSISDMAQLHVRDAHQDDGTEVYAFKFRLSGVTPSEAKKHMVQVSIYDRAYGTLLAVKRFALGQLPRGRISRDYAFFFTGRNAMYHVVASYYVDEGAGNITDMSLEKMNVYSDGGTEEVDDLRYDFTGESKYHLLQ